MDEFPPITELLPHRGRLLLLDRVTSVELPAKLTATRRFTAEEFEEEHFPGLPMVPGVLLVEGLAQSLACLAAIDGREGQVVLTGVDKVRFRAPVLPPCEVTFSVEVTGERLGVVTCKGEVHLADGKRACSANLSGAMVDRSKLGPAS